MDTSEPLVKLTGYYLPGFGDHIQFQILSVEGKKLSKNLVPVQWFLRSDIGIVVRNMEISELGELHVDKKIAQIRGLI